jgi:aminoglycoside phosphotransferase (APT) family kinase protein
VSGQAGPDTVPASSAGHTELANALAEVLGAGPVTSLRRLSGGASRETWAFSAADRPLILQRQQPRPARRPGMATEVALLRAAMAASVPVPAVVATGDGTGSAADMAVGAAWMVVEFVAGETIPRRILRDDEFRAARAALAGQCGEVLARIHRIDPASVGGLVESDPVVDLRLGLDVIGEPHPAFELGLRWLDRHQPPARTVGIVHGDFRNGNLVVGPEGLRAVLDWELAHLGDPLEDLGWLCVRAWRFGAAPHVGGFGELGDLLAAYEVASGAPVDRDALAWWEVLGTLKWGVTCIVQAATHLSGAVRSVELAAIGRRVCEVEYDLLELLR